MAGCHHRPNGHEFEQALRDGEGQGSLACCSPWGKKVGHSNRTTKMDIIFKKLVKIHIISLIKNSNTFLNTQD